MPLIRAAVRRFSALAVLFALAIGAGAASMGGEDGERGIQLPDESKRRLPRLGSPASLALRERAHELIPGGSHTYAKGDDQWPDLTPTGLARGQGCRVWDSDGNEFIEYALGARAVTLGHAYPDVVQ